MESKNIYIYIYINLVGPYTYTLNDEVEINNSNTIEPDEDIKDSTKSYIWSPLEDIINYEDIDDDMHTLYNTQCTCVEDFLEKSIERKKIKVTHLLSSMVTKQQDSMVSMDTNPCDIERFVIEENYKYIYIFLLPYFYKTYTQHPL